MVKIHRSIFQCYAELVSKRLFIDMQRLRGGSLVRYFFYECSLTHVTPKSFEDLTLYHRNNSIHFLRDGFSFCFKRSTRMSVFFYRYGGFSIYL